MYIYVYFTPVVMQTPYSRHVFMPVKIQIQDNLLYGFKYCS